MPFRRAASESDGPPEDLHALIDEERLDRDARPPGRTGAPEAPTCFVDTCWVYLALAMGIPVFPFVRFGVRATHAKRA